MEISGTASEAGANPVQADDEPPSGAKAKPPTATTPEPAGPPGSSATAAPANPRQRRSSAEKRSPPRASSLHTAPSAARANPSRWGCSRQNQGSAGARDAATVADGSTACDRGAVTLASTDDPEARARRSAIATRRSRRDWAAASSHSGAGPRVLTWAIRPRVALRLAAAAGDRDLARARHLDQPERPHE